MDCLEAHKRMMRSMKHFEISKNCFGLRCPVWDLVRIQVEVGSVEVWDLVSIRVWF